jgi:hypothetical protein
MAAITGTKLLPAGVKRYSTLVGTVPKSLRWIKPPLETVAQTAD